MKLRIKEIMEEKGITSAAIAQMVGIHKVSVSNIINGKQQPAFDTLLKFAEVLNVRVGELFDDFISKAPIQSTPILICPHCGKPIDIVVQKKEKELE